MVILIVLLTFAIVIVVRLYLDTARKQIPVKEEPLPVRPIPSKLFHPGYTWVHFDEPSSARIGIIGFMKELIGSLDTVELPRIGTAVQQGDPLMTLRHKKREITIYSPLSGRIEETQTAASDVNQRENGWLVRINPSNPNRELHNFMNKSYGTVWQDSLRMQLAQLFAPKIGPVLQDGGMLVPDFIDSLSDNDWERIRQEFFEKSPI